MADDLTIAAYDARVADYAELVDGEEPPAALVEFVEHLQPGSLVLDLGCGLGNAASFMLAWGLRVDAVDASREMVRMAQRKYAIAARQANFEDVTGERVFDGIWASFSLLHMQRENFPGYLRTLAVALNDQGVLHLAMKLGEGHARDALGRYYAYYCEAELRGYLADAGFDVISTTRGEGRGLAGTVEPWAQLLSRRRD